MIENPVRSPIVPPMADNISTNFADLSFVILSYVAVSKYILTNLKLLFHSKSEIIYVWSYFLILISNLLKQKES